MCRTVLAAILALTGACSSSGGGTVITVLGYTVVIKTAPPTTAQVGALVPIAFTVTENESDGTSKPASGKSFTVTVTAGGGTVNGTASATLTTAADGSVSLTWVLGSVVGTQALRGSVSSDHFLDISVTATAPPVRSVAVTLATPSIPLGTPGDQATAVLTDASGNVLLGRTVTWQSSNMAVATVSGTGVITTVGVGTTTITATSEGHSGTVTLTVAGVSFVEIRAGDGHSCGRSQTGAAYCWGSNFFGELGDGTITTQRLVPTLVSGGISFVGISAGGHSCGRSQTGSAYCWGRNLDGELGDGTTTIRLVPTLVQAP